MYDNFLYKAKQTVYKWWCVIYKPVYKLTHHGYWPAEKEPYYVPPDSKQQQLANQMAEQISNTEITVDIGDSLEKGTPSTTTSTEATTASTDKSTTAKEAPSQKTSTQVAPPADDNSAARAKEIMERLAREAAEDEAKKQAEIEAARQKAAEQDRLNSILKSTQRDISQYISEGMAHRADNQEPTPEEPTTNASDEALKRAQEIMDRLNREAAEDEAKKQAEIEAAKEFARQNNL